MSDTKQTYFKSTLIISILIADFFSNVSTRVLIESTDIILPSFYICSSFLCFYAIYSFRMLIWSNVSIDKSKKKYYLLFIFLTVCSLLFIKSMFQIKGGDYSIHSLKALGSFIILWGFTDFILKCGFQKLSTKSNIDSVESNLTPRLKINYISGVLIFFLFNTSFASVVLYSGEETPLSVEPPISSSEEVLNAEDLVLAPEAGLGLVDSSEIEPSEAPLLSVPEELIRCITDKHLVLVEDIGEGDLRYKAWPKPNIDMEPSIVINQGQTRSEGSGECRYRIFTFRNGQYTYELSELGCTDGSESEGTIGKLSVSRNGRILGFWECKSP